MKTIEDGFLLQAELLIPLTQCVPILEEHEGLLEKDVGARLDVFQGKDPITSKRRLADLEPIVAKEAVGWDLSTGTLCALTILEATVARICVEVSRKTAEARLDRLSDISQTKDGLGLDGLEVGVDSINTISKATGSQGEEDLPGILVVDGLAVAVPVEDHAVNLRVITWGYAIPTERSNGVKSARGNRQRLGLAGGAHLSIGSGKEVEIRPT